MARKDDTGIDQRIWDYLANRPPLEIDLESVPQLTEERAKAMLEQMFAEEEAKTATKQ